MSGGREIEVTASNVYDYVRKYAKYRMVKAQEKAIEVSNLVWWLSNKYRNIFCLV